MAFSAKIILGDGGVSGYNEWELIYDVSTQPTYKTKYGLSVSQPEADILWHSPDQGPQIPVRATSQNKVIHLQMDIPKDTWDEVVSSLVPLKLALNGADSQALDYQINGTSEPVKVAISTGGNYTTYYNVISGEIDDSDSYFKPEAWLNTTARQINFYMTVEPYGYGDSFTLKNDLASSPHFVEDSNGDGLADGAVTYGTPSGFLLPTNTYLIGGQCQQMTTDNANDEGVQTSTVTLSASQTSVFYAWVRVFGAGDPIRIGLYDGSNVLIQEKQFDPADPTGYDKTAIDFAGNTWYRYVVSGTNVNANVRGRVRRGAVDASVITNFFVDAWYLQTGTTTAPDGWCSTSALKNRYDPSAAEANINYQDVWGIPGDLPPLAKYSIERISIASANSNKFINLSASKDGKSLAANYKFWWDRSDLTYVGSGALAWTEVADASRSNGYYQLSPAGAYSDASFSLDLYSDFNTYQTFNRYPCRIFAICRTNGTGTVTLSVDKSATLANGSLEGDTVNLTKAYWGLIDIGLYNPSTDMSEATGTGAIDALTWNLTQDNAGTRFYLDAILCVPVSSGFSVGDFPTRATWANNENWVFSQVTGDSFIENESRYGQYVGNIPDIREGNTMTRIIWATYADISLAVSTDAHDLDDEVKIGLSITPRTSHLLGV